MECFGTKLIELELKDSELELNEKELSLAKIMSFIPVNPMTIFPLLTVENNHNYLVIIGVYSSYCIYYIITNITFGNLLFI